MKVELHSLMAGDLGLEVIAETDIEYRLLSKAWELNGYERGNGKTIAPNGGSTGFFIPLCRLLAPKKNLKYGADTKEDAA